MGIFDKKAPQARPQQPQAVKGHVHAVPCPFCGQRMDLRELYKLQMLDIGSDVECDRCGHNMQITQIVQYTQIAGVPSPNDQAIRARAKHQNQAPASGTLVRRR